MTELSTAKTRRTTNWSAIWVLPLIALLIGGWLAYRAYSEAGIEIEIFFPSGDGIQVNKTEVIYKGMSIGKVIGMELDDQGDQRGVRVTLEMDKRVDRHLRPVQRHHARTGGAHLRVELVRLHELVNARLMLRPCLHARAPSMVRVPRAAYSTSQRTSTRSS